MEEGTFRGGGGGGGGEHFGGIQALALQTGGDWYERSSTSPRRHAQSRSKKSAWQKFKDFLRSVVAFVFSNVGICVLVVGYLVLGAIAFQHLEGPEERKIKFDVANYRKLTVSRLWSITERYNTLHRSNWTRDTKTVVAEFQKHILEKASEGYDGLDIPIYQWTFSGALLYSITVITTIGYGHIAPVTLAGKLVTIIYALVGMPLFLLYLSNIGDIMAKSFKWVYSRCCQCRKRRQRNRGDEGLPPNPYSIHFLPQHIHTDTASRIHDSFSSEGGGGGVGGGQNGRELERVPEEEDGYSETYSMQSTVDGDDDDDDDGGQQPLSHVTVPVSLCLGVMISYICGGAILFGEWEGWGFLDGSYFCFITLSTIGFGDIVPGDSLGDQVDSSGPIPLVNVQFIFCSMYILLGMAVIAMCFNLMQESVVQAVTKLGKRLGIIKEQ